MEAMLNINLALEDQQTFQQPYRDNLVVEDVCIAVCKHLKIGPVARHLFALRITGTSIFLNPSFLLLPEHIELDFRIRFKPVNSLKLKTVDPQAYHYYFQQVRLDIIGNNISEQIYVKYKSEVLGLTVTDMYRVMLEKNVNREVVQQNYKKYMPKKLLKMHGFFVKEPIRNSLEQLEQCNSLNSEYLITQYLAELDNIAPEYLIEPYKTFAVIEDNLAVVLVKVLPPYFADSGVMYSLESKAQLQQWTLLCSIEELGYISVKKDGVLEISRLNGFPITLKFHSVPLMWSFVSLLNGYYRLSCKWNYNLCPLVSELKNLDKMMCHGPVGGEFSYAKLERITSNKLGCFIIRESEFSYTTYYIDVCLKDGRIPSTFKLEQTQENQFMFEDDMKVYKSIREVVQTYSNPEGNIYLRECVPPFDNDVSPLLLCRSDDIVNEVLTDIAAIPEPIASGNPYCINQKDLQMFVGHKKEGSRKLTVVYKGMWKVTSGKKVEVALKFLQKNQTNLLKNFSDSVGQWPLLPWSAVTRLLGIGVSGNDAFMVMEYFKLGPVDQYLRNNKSIITIANLIEAAANLASAVWHLKENDIVHGMIRCRKLMVSSHDKNGFIVKLSDNSIFTGYEPSDVHWIPVECYNNLTEKSKAGDVWALATTLFEIFTFGDSIPRMDFNETVMCYLSGKRLMQPEACPDEIYNVMVECWRADARIRKQPQAVSRDINQLMYQQTKLTYSSKFNHDAMSRANSFRCSHHSESDNWQQWLWCPPSDSVAVIDRPESGTFENVLIDPSQLPESVQNLSKFIDLSSFSTFASTLPVSNSSTEWTSSIENVLELNDRQTVIVKDHIGKGFFGDVFKGILENNNGSAIQTVALKKLTRVANLDISENNFLRKINAMKSIKHPNIVRILGALREPDLHLVMEYVPHGSLQNYLRIKRNNLETKQLLKFAKDIAMGMDYLSNHKFVHRDLAARNILMDDDDRVKITDFGLAQMTDNSLIRDWPIKWYAPESLISGKFSVKSDVWSYAVTLFEIFSYGEEPPMLGNIDHLPEGQGLQVLAEALLKGERYACPALCPQFIYVGLILPCWDENPQARPGFAQLAVEATNLIDRV